MRSLRFLCASFGVFASFGMAQAVNLVTNGNFAPANGGAGYGAIPGWLQYPYPSTLGGFPYLTGSNNFGQPFWDNGSVPGGISTVGFIQVYPGAATDSLTQSVGGLVVGKRYTFDYLENARNGSAPLVSVIIGGVLSSGQIVGGQTVVASHSDAAVGGNNAFRQVSTSFVATSTNENLTFLVSQGAAGNDSTGLFTGASITAVPGPPAVGIMGMGLLRLVTRRRRSRK